MNRAERRKHKHDWQIKVLGDGRELTVCPDCGEVRDVEAIAKAAVTNSDRKMKHAVAISGGKDSVAMALRLKELYPEIDFVYLITPTQNELPEMKAHWANLEKLLGKPLTVITNKSLMGLIYQQKALPNWRQRWCTRMIKIEPYISWMMMNAPVVSYVGIRADEPEREAGDYSDVLGVEMRFPMREWGWTIKEVFDYLEKREVCIPERTDCALCFFQRLEEWKALSEKHPDLYEQGIAAEEFTGHTFRSPNKDDWPASLKDLREEFRKGRVPRHKKTPMDEMKCRICRK